MRSEHKNESAGEKGMEKVLKAFANRRRLAILKFIKRNRRATVGSIAKDINLSFKSTSKHLAVLLAAGIVERDQVSLQMWYYLADLQEPAAKQIIPLL
jgi:DNA-binding transcriptional ArsR family regulator